MPFCANCGQQVEKGTKFCTNCGAIVVLHEKTKIDERKTFYDGGIRKCPNCGEIINAFVVSCPSCGYELRDSSTANSLQSLYSDLNKTTSMEQKALIIRSYPIPNAKEDIIEFMILASSNISGEADANIFEAWVAKFEQAYQKAQISLQNDSSFLQIEKIYKKTKRSIALEKVSHTATTTKNTITAYFKFMPNPLFAVVVIFFVVFCLIHLFNGKFSGFDIIFGAIILRAAYRITEKKEKRNDSQDIFPDTASTPIPSSDVYKIKVPSGIVRRTPKNYAVAETLFAEAGFTNVKSIPLNDLILGVTNKPGTISDITIDGKSISSRKKFDPDVPVVITYHSLKK